MNRVSIINLTVLMIVLYALPVGWADLRTGPEGYPVLFHPSIRLAVANSVMWVGHRS
ncbi:MAG: hypothetical protein JO114_09155 [Planctomycetaceae bacterium]|nr:hypothetical protein [Planctomycetaceae bacterium]